MPAVERGWVRMSVRPAKVGQRAVSRCGHDRGREYLVYRLLDERFLLVVDGDIRPLSKPKKKNVQHLDLCQETADGLVARLETGRASDVEVRQALQAWDRKRGKEGRLDE